jgi:hypothetical protein
MNFDVLACAILDFVKIKQVPSRVARCAGGIFAYQNSQFGYFEGLGMENVGIHILWPFGIFYSHLVNFMAIGYIYGHLVYFSHFSVLFNEKYGNTGTQR